MRCAVFFSGTGSTTEALLRQEENNDYLISLLVTDNPQAEGILHAHSYRKELLVLPESLATNNSQWSQIVSTSLDRYDFDIMVLAGFMRALSADYVATFENRIINIHPSLLPAFKGLNTHSRVLKAGISEHGFSIHLVTAELDAGPILAQGHVAVSPEDDAESLSHKVQRSERLHYPQVLQWIAEKRLFWNDTGIYMDNKPLGKQGIHL